MKYFLTFLYLFTTYIGFSQWIQYGQELSGNSVGDESGNSVAVSASGRIIAIGSPKSDEGGENSGVVRVYQNSSFINTTLWYQIGSDILGGSSLDQSGFTISLSGDGYTLAVTHINRTPAIVKVYRFRDNQWIQIGEDIQGLENDSDFFGISTSLSFDGNIISVGNSKGLSSKGYVQIFSYLSNEWTQVGQTIEGEAASDESGFSISLSDEGTIVAIGAPKNDQNGDKSGHVRVFKNISGTWTQVGDDIDGSAEKDYAGYSVTLNNDGTILAIGMPYNDDGEYSWCDPCTDAGKVRIYKNVDGAWTQVGEDLKGKAQNDRFGWSISLNGIGDILSVGAPGRSSDNGQVRVFKNTSDKWTQEGSDINGQSKELFGYSVSSNDDGNIFISGGIHNSPNNIDIGLSRAYINNEITSDITGNTWTLDQSIYGEYNSSSGVVDRVGVVTEISGDGKTFVTNHNTDNRFRIYKKGNDNVWALDTIISPKTSSDQSMTSYGFNPSFSLSYDGNTLAFGSRQLNSYSHRGYINVYSFDGSTWSQKGETIIGREDYMYLGWDLSLNKDGTRLSAGGPYYSSSNKIGKVLSYEYSIDQEKWIQLGNDITSKFSDYNGNLFGSEVDLNDDGDLLAVGSSSKTEVFKLEDNTWEYIGAFGISSNSGYPQYLNNTALSSDGKTIVLGFPSYTCSDFSNYRCKGMAQVYRFNNNIWTQVGEDIFPDIQDLNFGNSVAITSSGSRIIISGSENNYTSGGSRGSVYTYEFLSGKWISITQNIEGVNTDNNNNDNTYISGYGSKYSNPVSISDDGNTLLVGYPSGLSGGIQSSRIKLYSFSSSSSSDISSELVSLEDSYHFYNGTKLTVSKEEGVMSNDYSFSVVNYSAQLIEDVSYGSLVFNSDGSFSYDHDGSLHDDYFTYRLVDDKGKFTYSQYVFLNYSCGDEPISDTRVWNQIGVNIIPDSIFSDFGRDVAISDDGNTIAVSSPEDFGSTYYDSQSRGYVKLYQNILGRWVQMGDRIPGEVGQDKSGSSIALSSDGKTIAIGAPSNDSFNGTNAGHVRVYKFISGEWKQIGEDINGPSGNANSGYSLDMSADGEVLVIGAPNSSNYRGIVEVYELNESKEWIKITQINGAKDENNNIIEYFNFGYDVSINNRGDIISVGNYYYYSEAEKKNIYPFVNIYKKEDGIYSQWGESISTNDFRSKFGSSIDLSGDGKRIIIGSEEDQGNSTDTNSEKGKAQVYENINDSWVKLGKDLFGENNFDDFGKHVTMSDDGNSIAIGAQTYDLNLAIDAGRIYYYKYEGCDWRLYATIDGEMKSEYIGNIALNKDGTKLIRGSWNVSHQNLFGNFQTEGIARVYRLGEELPELSLSLSKDTITENFEKSIGTVSINKSFDYDVYAILSYSGTAQYNRYDIDYKYSQDTVKISAGTTSNTFYIESLVDPITDDNESVTITISSSINSSISSANSSKTVIITELEDFYASCDNFDYDLKQFKQEPGYYEYSFTMDGVDTSYQNMNLSAISNYSWVSNYKYGEPYGGGTSNNVIYPWYNQVGCNRESYYYNGWKERCTPFPNNFDNNYIKIYGNGSSTSRYHYLSRDYDNVGKDDFIEFDFYRIGLSENYLQIKNQSSNPDIESNWTNINIGYQNGNVKIKLKDYLNDFQGGDITVRFKIKFNNYGNSIFAFDNFCIKTPESYFEKVRLSIVNKEISEAKKQSTINLYIDEAYTEDIIVKLAYSGSATGPNSSTGNDYKIIGENEVTISKGNTSSSLTLETIDDGKIEEDETIIVSIDEVTNAFEAGIQLDTIKILDNDSLLTISSSIKHISCYGNEDGKISVSVSQGESPYSFSWTKDRIDLSFDNDTIDNLSPGRYEVTVTDAKGRYPTSKVFIVSEPDELKISVESFSNASCDGESDGNIDINVLGGTKPYKFLWSSGHETEDILTLEKGTYSLTVTDANGCTKTLSKVIDDSGRKSVNSSWYIFENFLKTSEDGKEKNQSSNNIYTVSFKNDSEGILGGEYGDLSGLFTSNKLNTSDSWGNHFYNLYDISEGKHPFNGGGQVDITYKENNKLNLNKDIINSYYFDDKKLMILAEDYIITKSSSEIKGQGEWESYFVDGTLTASHFISSSKGWISGRYNNNGFFFDEIRTVSIDQSTGLQVENTFGLSKKIYSIFSLLSEDGESYHLWGVGEKGHIVYSNDSGENWKIIESSSGNSNYKDIYGVDLGQEGFVKLILVKDDGQVVYTNFDLINHIFTETLTDKLSESGLNKVKFLSNGYGFIVGDKGKILYSENFGNSWININSGTQEDLNDIEFGDCSNVYIVGDNGVFMKSSNFNISDISIDNLEIDENLPSGSFIGLITSIDDDQYADHKYTLISGNEYFIVQSDSLFSNQTFNFENTSLRTFSIKSINSNGKVYSKSFIVTINDKDEIFDIYLSSNKIQENRVKGSTIGELTVNDQNTSAGVIFELIDSLDSDKFTLNGITLLSDTMFDYENKDEHKVVIKAKSSGGYSFIKVFTIIITDAEDVNSISLSNNTIDENSGVGSVVGNLITDNANANFFANFSLTESTQFDNDKFKIEDNKLLSLEVFDYEIDRKSYTVEVSVVSSGFNNLTDTVNVFVNNLPDAIDDVYLTNSSINENLLPGGTVGELVADDQYDILQYSTNLIITGVFETKNREYQGLELYAVRDIEDLSKYGISVSNTTTGSSPNQVLTATSLDAGQYFMIYYSSNWKNFFSTEESSSYKEMYSAELYSMSYSDRHNIVLYDRTSGSWEKVDIVGNESVSSSLSDWDVEEGWLYRKNGRGASKIFIPGDWNIKKKEFSLIGGTSVNGNDLASNPYPLFSYTISETSQTFELVFGEGDDHNNLFEIVGNKLIANETFDYETKDTYSVRVKATSSRGYSLEKILTISVNDLPDQIEDITLSNNEINENENSGSFIGYLLAQDQFNSATHTFELVQGAGSEDNQYFSIDKIGNNSVLLSKAVFDYETRSVFSVRVEATSSNGGYTFEKIFSISVKDLPDQILDISLSSNEIYENQPINTLIGEFSAEDQLLSATHTFELISGQGSENNSLFIIVEGSKLKSRSIFNYESKSSYSIRVRASSSNGGYIYEKAFTVKIKDLPDAINDISLSNSSVHENLEIGSFVGNLTSDDQLESATHTYTLVSGAIDFNIINSNQLVTRSTFDYEDQDTYIIRVRSTSSNGGYYLEKNFTISVNDLIEDITLSSSSILENRPVGSVIGTLSTDGAWDQFNIVSGEGDWESFSVLGNSLISNEVFDFENKDTYNVSLRAVQSNGWLFFDKTFEINILDDISDNCDPNLSYSGDINSFGSLRVNQTDSLNPKETDYKIISLPFDGYSLSNFTSEMRSDQFVLNQWNGTSYSTTSGTSTVGRGYMFLSTLRPSQIEGTHNECRPSVSISLSGNWTMLGNPYLENIEWSKIQSDNGVLGSGFMVYNNGWTFQQSLPPLRGAFISSEELQTGSIQINNPKLNSIEREFNGKNYSELKGEEWLLDLELKGGNLHHKIAQVGERDDASDQRDRYDLGLPPSLGYDYGIRFSNGGSRDIRETGSANNVWDFTVDNNYTFKSTIYWSLQSSHTSNLYLLDTESGDIVNMSSESSYSYIGLKSKSFKIIKGDLAFISEQTGRAVGGFRLYPNPTSQYLYVESYAKVSTDQIKVYTVDGKEVIPSSKDIVKDDALSQITRLGVRRLKRGTYVLVMSGYSKVFVVN